MKRQENWNAAQKILWTFCPRHLVLQSQKCIVGIYCFFPTKPYHHHQKWREKLRVWWTLLGLKNFSLLLSYCQLLSPIIPYCPQLSRFAFYCPRLSLIVPNCPLLSSILPYCPLLSSILPYCPFFSLLLPSSPLINIISLFCPFVKMHHEELLNWKENHFHRQKNNENQHRSETGR